MELSHFQLALRDRALALFGELGHDVRAREQVSRFEHADDEPSGLPATELSIILPFSAAGHDYELWIYADEAGVLARDEDFVSFDLDEYPSEDALMQAVIEHVRGLCAVQREEAAEEE